ncbi:Ferritin light chain [Tupaia chinensis]|uniref:Ferritin light chain n=1 Tax=Tupaia chinensis TaxID=246437 RepID=L9KX08_TUPCH|nr:Ferritin light chain [Tupaia chinensis]
MWRVMVTHTQSVCICGPLTATFSLGIHCEDVALDAGHFCSKLAKEEDKGAEHLLKMQNQPCGCALFSDVQMPSQDKWAGCEAVAGTRRDSCLGGWVVELTGKGASPASRPVGRGSLRLPERWGRGGTESLVRDRFALLPSALLVEDSPRKLEFSALPVAELKIGLAEICQCLLGITLKAEQRKAVNAFMTEKAAPGLV